jgi:micrococcal nuclease
MRPTVASILALLLVLCLPYVCAPADMVFRANVLEILSADIILLKKSDGEKITVKLAGIDCPRKGQSHFIAARLFASQRVLGQEVTVKPEKGSAMSGKPLPVTILFNEGGSQRSLNKELLEAGMARWSDPHSSADSALGEIEAGAKKLRRGLWADPSLTPTFGSLPIK